MAHHKALQNCSVNEFKTTLKTMFKFFPVNVFMNVSYNIQKETESLPQHLYGCSILVQYFMRHFSFFYNLDAKTTFVFMICFARWTLLLSHRRTRLLH